MAALIVPIGMAMILIGIYNFARFHAFGDFGFRYQLAGINQHSLPMSEMFTWRFIVPNLYGDLAAPLYWQNSFPYVLSHVRLDSYFTGRQSWLGTHLRITRDNYNYEALVGLLWTQPFLLLAMRTAKSNRLQTIPDSENPARWLALSLLAAAVLGLAPTLTISGSTMRYLLDAVPCLTILAALGYWRTLEQLEFRPRVARALRWIVGLTVFGQCVIGVLLAIVSYRGNFFSHNPDLYFGLRSALPTFNW